MSKKDKFWLDQIQQCRESGLTDRQWCIHNNISPSTFYYHVKTLREKACQLPEPICKEPQNQEVVPLNFTKEPVHMDYSIHVPAVRMSIHGIDIEILNQADEVTIANTILALRQLC